MAPSPLPPCTIKTPPLTPPSSQFSSPSSTMGLKSLVNKMMKLYERAAGKLGRGRKVGLLALPASASMLPFLHGKRPAGEKKKDLNEDEDEVWRRTIMMGEKCQPLEFSGVIFYDEDGRQVPSVPRSPLRGQHTFMLSSPHRC